MMHCTWSWPSKLPLSSSFSFSCTSCRRLVSSPSCLHLCGVCCVVRAMRVKSEAATDSKAASSTNHAEAWAHTSRSLACLPPTPHITRRLTLTHSPLLRTHLTNTGAGAHSMVHRRVMAAVRARIGGGSSSSGPGASHAAGGDYAGSWDGRGRSSTMRMTAWSLAGCSALLFVWFVWFVMPARPLEAGSGILNLKGSNEWSYCEAPLKGEEGVLPTRARPRELKQVQLVIRHGDRSPITSLTTPPPDFDCKLKEPTIRFVAELVRERFHVAGIQGKASLDYLTRALLHPLNDSQQPNSAVLVGAADKAAAGGEGQACFPGQLTERGVRQQLSNGRYLQERYGKALGVKDVEKEVYFRSTNYPRTFTSGAALLLSFLAPLVPDRVPVIVQEDNNKEPLFGRGLIGASRPRNVDPFQSPADERGSCEAAFSLAARQEKTFLMDADLEQAFFEQLNLAPAAEAEARHLSVADATDPLMGMACHKHPLPVHRSLVRSLKEETDRMFCERFAGAEGGREGTRLGMQPFLKEVLGRFQEHGSTKLKLALYSAHDTVLSPLLGALDVLDKHCYWPPYASRVVFEMWGPPAVGKVEGGEGEEKEEDAVRILYNGEVVSRRSLHCPTYKAKGGKEVVVAVGEETLLPLGCLQEYIEGMSPLGEGKIACA